MSPCNAYRSFAISLVIVFAIIESPISGFTILRTANITEETDLTGEESSILTVRHDQKRPNDINNNDSGKSDSKEKFTSETKPNSQDISTDSFISKITEFAAGTISTLEDFNRKFTSSKSNDHLSFTQNGEIETHIKEPTKTSPFTTRFTTSRGYDQSDIPPSITTAQSETTYLQNDNSKNANNVEVTKTIDGTLTTREFLSSTNDSTTSSALQETSTPKYNISKLKTYTLAKDLTAITLSVDELYSLRDLASSITETVPSEIANTHNSNVPSTYFNSQTSPTVPIEKFEINAANTKPKNKQKEVQNYSYSTIEITKLGTELADNVNAITTAESVNSVPIDHLRKKYTNIERKRVTSDASVTTESEFLNKAETSQTRASFDKAFSPNPNTSFDKFTDDLVTINNMLLTTKNDFSSVTEQDYTPYEFTTSKPSSRPMKIGVISSKMAGFLDYSKVSTPNVDTVQISESIKNINESEASTSYEVTTVVTDTTEIKITKATESQSQLTNDAINEELLKEELMNDNEDAKRYREGRTDIFELKEVKPLAVEVTDINNLASNRTENTLIVQPINHDKIKNTILYAVSSKYKPMKKIDIQPPKQFVRDPDDNSWRNESISSLGIVFKPKNSSKSYTQVLKNKTEVELSNLSDRDSKGGVPDLRQRLEKIAEVRKSKKKKINKYGDTVYVDYEEGNISSEVASLQKENKTLKNSFMGAIFTTTPATSEINNESEKDNNLSKRTNASTKEIDDIFKRFELDALTTDKSKKYYNVAEYYDTTDEYDVDYLNMSNIDLKKYTMPITERAKTHTTPQTPASVYVPERKPTVQYFPPTTKKAKVNANNYDDDFQKEINLYTVEALPKELRKALSPASFATMGTPPPQMEKIEEIKSTPSGFKSSEFGKTLYFTDNAKVTQPQNAFVNEPNSNRGSYIIKHYKDFLNVAAKDDDYRNEYITFTESPIKGITISELTKENGLKTAEDDYDYEQQFRKDILDRFVANFNQNSERFKVDFPILFNNSVVHRKVDENGRVLASSTAFMKRLYDVATTKSNPYILSKPCDSNCDKIAVELSPAYELHYYVPEQEEKLEAEQQPATVGYHS